MTATTNTSPISVDDRVQYRDQRRGRDIGVVKECTEDARGCPLGAWVEWPDDGSSHLGRASRQRSWIATDALIRVGGVREGLTP